MPTILLLFLISDFLNKPYHRYYYDDHKYADGYAAYFLLEIVPILTTCVQPKIGTCWDFSIIAITSDFCAVRRLSIY